MLWLSLCLPGCVQPWLAGECTVPGDVETTTLEGTVGSEFGISLAFEHGALLMGAPGAGSVHAWPTGEVWNGVDGLGAWVFWEDGVPHAVVRGDGSYRLTEEVVPEHAMPGVQAFAFGSLNGLPTRVWADGFEVVRLTGGEEQSIQIAGVTQLVVGDSWVLGVRCDTASCEVWRWDGEAVEVEPIAESGLGARVAEESGVFWWSDPMLGQDLGTGRVTTEDGEVFEGLPGDHLGRSLSSRFASGVVNKSTVPMRARVIERSGQVWAVSDAEENAWVSTAEDLDRVAFGISRALSSKGSSGRVEVFSSTSEGDCGAN